MSSPESSIISGVRVRASADVETAKPADTADQSPESDQTEGVEEVEQEEKTPEQKQEEAAAREAAAYRRGVAVGQQQGYDHGYSNGSVYFLPMLLLLMDFGG